MKNYKKLKVVTDLSLADELSLKKNIKMIFLMVCCFFLSMIQTMAREIDSQQMWPSLNQTNQQMNDVLKTTENKSISGRVTDSSGVPLPGVSVIIKGTSKGTITDMDGNFSLTGVQPADVLVFSFIGMRPVELAVGGQNILNVTMEEESVGIEEVVAVGYGTMEKRMITSSITSVKGDNLVSGLGGATVASALQGKIAGLTISGTSSPNSSNGFQLRGVASVNASKGPLVVIDGMPSGDIRSVNQEDILSVDVLKDASAGAIYGTRAAGGVILITTKQGQSGQDGKVKITYTGEFSSESIRKRPEVLSAEEYLSNGMGGNYGSDVDWYDELTRDNPFSHKQVLNISSSTRYTSVYGTFMYQDQKGIAVNDGRQDYSGRINANFKLLDNFLEIKTHVDYRQADRDQRTPDFEQALRNNPTRSPYDPSSETGFNVWTNDKYDFNTLADSYLSKNGGLDKWLNADATIKLNFTPELSFQNTIGYQNKQWEKQEYRSKWHRTEIENSRTGTAYLGFSKTDNVSLDGYVTFIKDWGNKHNLNATAGYSFYESNSEYFNMTNYNFPVDGIGVWDMGSGTYLSDGSGSMESGKDPRERLLAFFGRVNYSFEDKYILSATYRREGSSKFGKNNQWGNFWAISGGWRISDEPFMKSLSWINDLKIRLGYGVTGNNGFNAGYSKEMYASDTWWLMDGEWGLTYGKKANVNYDLKWEEKGELNFGLDYSLFNNRLYGKFDVYKRKVDDLIFEAQAPTPPYTKDKIYKNIGSLENKGWEMEIGGDIVKNKEFSYSSVMRISHNKTKITSLAGDGTYIDNTSFPAPGSPGTATRLQAGSVIGKYYIWRYAGIDDNGNWLLYDKNDNIIPAADKTQEDKAYVGNAIPKLIISWDHLLRYKNWDMTINLHSWIDFDVFNTVNMYFGLSQDDGTNVLKDAFGKYKHIKGEKELCDFWLDDGTFFKIDAINLGYSLNLKKYVKQLDNVRFYITVGDVATLTGYNGLNPEVNINGLEPGFEWWNSIYPQTRRYTLGFQLTF